MTKRVVRKVEKGFLQVIDSGNDKTPLVVKEAVDGGYVKLGLWVFEEFCSEGVFQVARTDSVEELVVHVFGGALK